MEVQLGESVQSDAEGIINNDLLRNPIRIIRQFEGLRNLGTHLGTKPCHTPSETVIQDAWKCKKRQLHSISGFNSVLEVRVLPGSPHLHEHSQTAQSSWKVL